MLLGLLWPQLHLLILFQDQASQGVSILVFPLLLLASLLLTAPSASGPGWLWAYRGPGHGMEPTGSFSLSGAKIEAGWLGKKG
jgi:hypothetical protein